MSNAKAKFINPEQVHELNEKHGWFSYGDAQSDVSNAFANEAIERYERIRSAAPELLHALQTIVNAGEWYASAIELDAYGPDSMDGEALERLARAAIAKATGGEGE